MRIDTFKYKPRCITLIKQKDFEEEGINFTDIYEALASVKYDTIAKVPLNNKSGEKLDGLHVQISTLDQSCKYLAKFNFALGGSNYRLFLHPFIELLFPFKADYNESVDRDPAGVGRIRAFPNSVDYLGYTLGNYHLLAKISNLFDISTSHIITFDEDGNYIPVVSTENPGVPYCHYTVLRYTAEDLFNPIDLDKMLIPELCNAKIGKYYFWLDRFHFVQVYDHNKIPSSRGDRFLKIVEIFSMYCYNKEKSIEANYESCSSLLNIDEADGPIWKPSEDVSSFASLVCYYLCDNNQIMRKIGKSQEAIGDMATIRRVSKPLERKALELYEILNSDVRRFAKQVVFPNSIRKMADAISPLVVKTTQIIRSCKSMQWEEI